MRNPKEEVAMSEQRLSTRIKALGWPIVQVENGDWHVTMPGHESDPFIYHGGIWVEEYDGELLGAIQEYEWMHSIIKKHYA
jgi:hypothetical protein